MGSKVLSRRLLTNWFIGYLKSSIDYVGDGVAPPDAGWNKGQPDQGQFTPYVVVSISNSAGSFAGVNDLITWRVFWTVGAHGATREQADWVADKARALYCGMWPCKLTTVDGWRLNLVEYQMGSLIRQDSTDPPYWSTSDTVIFTLNP